MGGESHLAGLVVRQGLQTAESSESTNLIPVLETFSLCVGLKEDFKRSEGAACREHLGHRVQEFPELLNIFPFPISGSPVFGGWKALGFPCTYPFHFCVQGQAEYPLRVHRYNVSPLAICDLTCGEEGG